LQIDFFVGKSIGKLSNKFLTTFDGIFYILRRDGCKEEEKEENKRMRRSRKRR